MCVNHTTTATVQSHDYSYTLPWTFWLHIQYITLTLLECKNLLVGERVGGTFLLPGALQAQNGLDVPPFFFLPFILPEFQWPLQATSDCWILRNVLSELYKKPSAQRAQLKTKHANCYNFSIFWVCGKCCTDCRATFIQKGVRGFEAGGRAPTNGLCEGKADMKRSDKFRTESYDSFVLCESTQRTP